MKSKLFVCSSHDFGRFWLLYAIIMKFHRLKMLNKPNQELDGVRYNCEFVITVIVITEFDCINLMYVECNLMNIFLWTLSKSTKLQAYTNIVDTFYWTNLSCWAKAIWYLIIHNKISTNKKIDYANGT